MFDHPTSSALAGFVSTQLQGQHQAAAAAASALQPAALGVRAAPGADAAAVASEVAQIVAGMLGAEVAPTQPLMEAGLDSLAAVELRTELGSRFGVELPATAMFDYPTISALAGFIAAASSTEAGAPMVQLPGGMRAARPGGELLTAVAGLSCRYPAAVDSAADFWGAATAAADLPRQVPASRWDLERLYAPDPAGGKMYARFAAFIDDVESFDPQARRGAACLSSCLRARCSSSPLAHS